MSKTKMALLGAALFILGAAAGGYGGFVYASSVLADFLKWGVDVRRAADMQLHVTLLKSLRDSKSDDVVATLEALLDADLAAIGMMSPEDVDDSNRKALRRVADYRSKYPREYRYGKEMDEAIGRALGVDREPQRASPQAGVR